MRFSISFNFSVLPLSLRVVSPDNTYEVLINGESDKKGSLLEDFQPPVNPPKEIEDPNDTKPEDWVDDATIPDPDATKVNYFCLLFINRI